MKQILFIVALLLTTSIVSAQKVVRDSIRSGNKAFLEQRYHEAESNYKSAIAKDSKSKEASFNLANTYYKQSRWDEALKEYEHYLTVESENTQNMAAAWHNVGNAMLKKKDLKQSMEAYKKALRLNPTDDDSRYNLAVVQKIIKDKEDNNQDQDQNQDKDQDKQEQDKQDQKQDQDKQDQKQNQDNKDKQDQKPEEQDNQQLSKESANQILQAIEQDEKETQEKVKQMKAAERQKQNENNRKQNKDW